MRKLFIIPLLLLGMIAFGQTGIQFEDTTFASLLEKSKKENKPIFLDAYTTWCGPCKLMAKQVFTLQTVGDFYNANFINAKMDMEKGEGIKIAKKFNIKSYPTYLIIDGNGELINKKLGFTPENDFIQFGKDVLDPTKKLSVQKKKFDQGEKDPKFLQGLTVAAFDNNDRDLATKSLTRYFQVKNKDLAKNDIDFLLFAIAKYLNYKDNPAFKILSERKADIIKVTGKDGYDKLKNDIVTTTISMHSINKATGSFDDALFLSEGEKLVGKDQALVLLNNYKIDKALRSNDIATYEKLALEKYKNYTSFSAAELNNAAWNFFENVNTKSSLEKAILWAQEAVKKGPSYDNTDTLANLYNKIGDKANAKIWAVKAIEAAKSSGKDPKETQALLDSLK